MNTARFDIVAKIPRDTMVGQLHSMQQDLLITRFQLALHFEQKEMPGYDLVVAKDGPKFKESVEDPPDYTPPPAPASMDWNRTDGFPILPPELAAYFADQLQRPVTTLQT